MNKVTNAEEREFFEYVEDKGIQPIPESDRVPVGPPKSHDELTVQPGDPSIPCCNSPQGSMDLHGKTVDEAEPAVNDFLAKSQSSDSRRCVLIITGKGSPQKGTGILRRKVPAWLKQNHRVYQHRAAPWNYGNEGAFCVVLRSRNEITKNG